MFLVSAGVVGWLVWARVFGLCAAVVASWRAVAPSTRALCEWERGGSGVVCGVWGTRMVFVQGGRVVGRRSLYRVDLWLPELLWVR